MALGSDKIGLACLPYMSATKSSHPVRPQMYPQNMQPSNDLYQPAPSRKKTLRFSPNKIRDPIIIRPNEVCPSNQTSTIVEA